MSLKKWTQAKTDPKAAQKISEECGVSPFIAEILTARGIDSAQDAAEFLNPSQPLYDPYLMKDMDKAVGRIREALENGEQITVYGDYDCDGVTATAMLFSYLESMGAQADYYLPDRFLEGYGLNCPAIEKIAQNGATLIITVDNGVSAIEEIAYAKTLGVDVIVTDHHQPKEQLPDAAAVVDPHRKDCGYPFKHLAGVGVAFKLICALEEADGEDMMEYYGDVLAVGTIGDIVSLQGENRVIVKKGLEQLKNTGNIGLRTLSETCGIPIEKEESIPVSFGIVPRINAAGRIADPKAAVRLLLTDDDEEARMLSGLIDQNNRNRKELEEGIVRDIAKRLASDRLPLMERVVVLEAESWHQGVVGIVAAKLVNRYSKPCILISIDGEEACGSGRSVEGFSLIDAVSACSECLTHYGGHKMAAGFSLKTKDIGRFKELLSTYTLTHYPDMPFHSLLIDKELRAEELTVPNIAALKRLEPFGQGNPKPLFCVREAVLTGICELSGGKHLKLQLSKGGAPFYALLFGQTKREFPYRVKDRLDLAADCDINHYNGADSVSLKVKDLRLSGLREEALFGGRNLYDRFLRQEKLPGGAAASIVPTREDVAVVYRYLRGCGVFAFDTDILFSRIPQAEMGYCKMMMILEILEELGLIRTSDREIQVVSSPQKTNIEQSAFLQKLRQL